MKRRHTYRKDIHKEDRETYLRLLTLIDEQLGLRYIMDKIL